MESKLKKGLIMVEYPTEEEKKKAIKDEKIYCRKIKGCEENWCCYFCSIQSECHIRCGREYWTLCKLRINVQEITWTKVFGGDDDAVF